MTAHTHTLTERVTTEVRLTPADVQTLLGRHRAHLRLTPAGRPDWFRLTPTGHIGTIVTPDCRLEIRPKIPLRNVLFLLAGAADAVPAGYGQTETVPADGVPDLLASVLTRHLNERAAAGLHRGYRERAAHGPFLQGRLDVAAQLQGAPGRRDQLHSRFDDFTLDVPCNQVPRATAELMLQSPHLSAAVRAGLRQALVAFGAASAVALDARAEALFRTDRQTEAYRPLLDLCRLLAEGLTPTGATGPAAGPTFLLNLERLFEQFLLGHVERYFGEAGGVSVAVQPWRRGAAPRAGQPDWQVHPDLLLERGGRPVLVLDAKWKRLPAARLLTADVYQVLAYCAALGVRQGVLVYPGRRERVWRYEPEAGGPRLAVRTVRVSGTRAELLRSVRRLLRWLNGTQAEG